MVFDKTNQRIGFAGVKEKKVTDNAFVDAIIYTLFIIMIAVALTIAGILVLCTCSLLGRDPGSLWPFGKKDENDDEDVINSSFHSKS